MNNYLWLDSYCLSFPGAVKDFKEEWNATRYQVGEKMFAMQGEDNTGRSIITLKLEPSNGDFLRTSYKDVIPGYYMNKLHWNSVYLDGEVPEDVLRDMIAESYTIVFESLTKKMRVQIQENVEKRGI
mgnify:CR=1 FL=1